MVTRSTLQEDIAATTRQVLLRGRNILGRVPGHHRPAPVHFHPPMIHKHPPRPYRLRQIPPSFSWVDHRLVRHQHLRRSGPESWALYLFLVTVADAQGLSYYSEASIARYLNLDPVLIAAARQHLIQLSPASARLA